MDAAIRTAADTIQSLKQLRRAGWLRGGVGEAACESVAEHTFGVALLALLLPAAVRLDVNREHCLALAVVHDLAESVVGDITPHDGVDPAEKRRREEAAVRDLASKLGDPSLIDLWLEFEAGETAEAKLVRELDVIEMAMQAAAYERAGKLSAADTRRFVESAHARISSEWSATLLAMAGGDTTARSPARTSAEGRAS
jgi:putative hydrolase of HD superfamily